MISYRLELVRRWFEPERTVGELYIGGVPRLFTLEPGSVDVEYPRIPTGFYLLERHGWESESRVKYKQTWAIVGADVSHFHEPGVPRSAVLFHSGNWDEETRGCPLLGVSIGHTRGETAMIASREAMNILREEIGDRDALLTISEVKE